MTVELIAPRLGLVETIASRLTPTGRDYSRHWVVFPEKRPAYYLRRELAKREGSGFLPPVIDSIDGFIDRLHDRIAKTPRLPIDVLDAVAILLEIHRSAPSRLGGDHFVNADRFFPLGIKIFNDLEELTLGAVGEEDLRTLDRWSEESIPGETLNRVRSLAFFHRRFYEEIESRGMSTPASRFRDVPANLKPDVFDGMDSLIFAGFFSLTKTEAGLIKTLLPMEKFSLLLMKGRGVETVFEKLGLEIPESGNTVSGPEPSIEFVRSPDTHGQVFALNGIVKSAWGEGRLPDERHVVVLPAAESLFPLYEHTLSSLPEEEFNISLGYPLSRTPIAGFFDDLMELCASADEEGRLYAPHYIRFALHPYTKNIHFPGPEKRTDLTRILFHAVEEEFSARRNKAFWSPAEIENDEGIRKAVQDKTASLEGAPDVDVFMDHLRNLHARLLAPFSEIRSVGELAAKTAGILNFIYENSTARLHYFFHPYAEAFMNRLEALSQSLLRDLVFTEKGSYFDLFRRVVSAGSVPFHGTPLRGLQILGFWETRCIRFEDVTILDADEDVLPAYRRVDSLLPYAARRALGLPTYKDNERRMEYYLDTLVAGASKIRFLFVENDDRQRSRFVERLIWERQKRDGEPRPEKYVRTVQYNVALRTSGIKPVAKTREMAEFLKSLAFSATSLDAYLACPLGFHYAYVLNLREKEEISEELESRDIGTLVHSILEDYFAPFSGKNLRVPDLEAKPIEDLVDKRFAAEYGSSVTGNAYLMNIQCRRHLGAFITKHQIPLIRSLEHEGLALKILSLERRMETSWEEKGSTFRLAAKMDRTEMRGGELNILDYKTGSNLKRLGIRFDKLDPEDRGTWNEAVSSLQIPLYVSVCSRKLKMAPEDVHGRFLMLGKNLLGPGIEFSPYNEEDPGIMKKQIAVMERIIGRLLIEITDPETPFDPALSREGACKECPYTVICGRS